MVQGNRFTIGISRIQISGQQVSVGSDIELLVRVSDPGILGTRILASYIRVLNTLCFAGNFCRGSKKLCLCICARLGYLHVCVHITVIICYCVLFRRLR